MVDFIAKCFVRDIASRPKADELLKHPIFAAVNNNVTTRSSVYSHYLKNDLNNPSYEGLQDTLRSLHRTRRAKFNRAIPDFPSSPDVNRRVDIHLFSSVYIFFFYSLLKIVRSRRNKSSAVSRKLLSNIVS